MLCRVILAAIVCLTSTGLSVAQDFQKPGTEHARLREIEGKWDAVMVMGEQKTKATATYKSINGGMWLASDFDGDLGGGLKFQGHGLDGYDQQKKKYVGIWTDSMSSAPLHLEGDYDSKSKQLVMTGESTNPDGKRQKVKTTTESKDKDHFTFKMYMVDADGKDQLAFTIEYSRQK